MSAYTKRLESQANWLTDWLADWATGWWTDWCTDSSVSTIAVGIAMLAACQRTSAKRQMSKRDEKCGRANMLQINLEGNGFSLAALPSSGMGTTARLILFALPLQLQLQQIGLESIAKMEPQLPAACCMLLAACNSWVHARVCNMIFQSCLPQVLHVLITHISISFHIRVWHNCKCPNVNYWEFEQTQK